MKRFIGFISGLLITAGLTAQVAGDYRSVASGNWATLATWQSYNGVAWVAAAAAPNSTNGTITIQSPNTVTVAAAVTVDQVVVNAGGTLATNAAIVLTIADGAGDDLTINGTMLDASSASVVWSGVAPRWIIGAAGNFIKQSASSSNNWQTFYSGGIATIPVTANWIVRKAGTANPSISTIGAYYPNLTFENNTANNWYTTVASTFNGAGGFPTIKGNLDVGGSGTGTLDFLNDCQNAQATLVLGNVTVKAGSKIRNRGTGLEIRGNLNVNGDINYNGGTGLRKIIFSGTNNQTINGAGYLLIYGFEVNKAAGTVTLNRPVTIDNNGTFTAGSVVSTTTNVLTFTDNATATVSSGSSFVSGPVKKYDYGLSGNFTFPVGKNSDGQLLAMAGVAATPFWTEAFSNACASGCVATGYVGPNGSWTLTNTGANATSANDWYISAAEDGNAHGACGSGNVSNDPSLHLGSTSLGDIGAAFDNGALCGFFGICASTNKRIESPAVNCTGRSNLIVSFNYLEQGSGTLDNATLWYFNGAVWALLVDLPKTYCCTGNCTGSQQGLWQNFKIALPASANNNANVKIGFNWTNNEDGAGIDPSFAVDDITITDNYWTAEYFYNNPQIVYNNTLAVSLNAISSCEYWILDRNSTAGTKNVTLNWDANSCGIVTPITDMRVARFDGAMWQDEGNSATTGNTAAGSVTSIAVSSFSPFTLAAVLVPLPIELLKFEAIYNAGKVDLSWCTATEINNDFFTVERSADGVTFENLFAVDGAGNSNQVLCYAENDFHPLNGVSYYRLKQTDFNGDFSYSPIRVVNVTPQTFTGLQVTADESAVVMQFLCETSNVADVRITDVLGNTVASGKINCNNPLRVARYNMRAGVYFVTVFDGVESFSRKIVLN